MDWRAALHTETHWSQATREAYAWHLSSFEGWLGGLHPTTQAMNTFLEGRLEAGVSASALRQCSRALSWAAAIWNLDAPTLPGQTSEVVQLWEAVLWRLHTWHGLSAQQLSRLRVHHVEGRVLRYGHRPVRLTAQVELGLRRVAEGRALSAPLFADAGGRALSARRLGQHLRRVERVS
jgi:hypothetical protein